jgi:NAD(P)-dependent dehydrogenase (short-subunit alcohol dehydrogenase family)
MAKKPCVAVITGASAGVGRATACKFAKHRRREVFVGLPTVEAVTANKMFPGYLDRYLAK